MRLKTDKVIVVEAELGEKIKILAKEDGRTIKGFIRKLVDDYEENKPK